MWIIFIWIFTFFFRPILTFQPLRVCRCWIKWFLRLFENSLLIFKKVVWKKPWRLGYERYRRTWGLNLWHWICDLATLFIQLLFCLLWWILTLRRLNSLLSLLKLELREEKCKTHYFSQVSLGLKHLNFLFHSQWNFCFLSCYPGMWKSSLSIVTSCCWINTKFLEKISCHFRKIFGESDAFCR